MVYYKDLKKVIFESVQSPQIDRFLIVSGFLGPWPIEELKRECQDLPIDVIYGMYAEQGIKKDLHENLIFFNTGSMNIWYSNVPVHSKIYLGFADSRIVFAKIGSANFSTKGLCNDYREILVDVDQEDLTIINDYCESIKNNCTLCSKIKNVHFKSSRRTSFKTVDDVAEKSDDECILSLLVNGEVPPASGLNWGFGNGHTSRSHSEAYIKIPSDDVKNHPLLFPSRKIWESPPMEGFGLSPSKKDWEREEVDLIWDDGTIMKGLLEGTTRGKGNVIPKQLSSADSKKIIGEYLRKRIGVDINKKVTKDDLINYGRTDIKISLASDGVYKLDFSV